MTLPFSATRTSATRSKAYEETTEAVSAVGPPRSLEEVIAKIQKMKCLAKKRASDFFKDKNKTGGGPMTVPPLTEMELRFVSKVRHKEGVLYRLLTDRRDPEYSNTLRIESGSDSN
jgi:hypothetical protein